MNHFISFRLGLVDDDVLQENANDELVKLMPTLRSEDVAAALVFAISVKDHVEVGCCFSVLQC